MKKVITIIGPTACGKSKLAIEIAKKFNGFLVCADSRQIYKNLNIITGKDVGVWVKKNNQEYYEVQGVKEFLVDLIKPTQNFTLADYQKLAFQEIKQNIGLPIIVGGTGLYVFCITENYELPKGLPNLEIRKNLENRFKLEGIENLYNELQTVDPQSAFKIQAKNPNKIIRALEYFIQNKKSITNEMKQGNKIFDVLKIGLTLPKEELYKKIDLRIDEMLKNGGWEEVKNVLQKYNNKLNGITGIGYTQYGITGIGYTQLGKALNGEISKKEAIELFKRDTKKYAKRQMTWFKRDKEIIWFNANSENLLQKISEQIENFLF